MVKRPEKYDANLPRNLTYRRRYKSYYWRNPLTKKEFSLGQRREDIALMRFDQVVDGRLLIDQGKTGAMISLPLDLELRSVGLRLGTVIDRCRLASSTDFMVSAGKRKNSPDGSLHPDGLTKKFVTARSSAGIEFEDSPPTFHEIRSLAGRLYEKEKGKEFARKLLGHKSGKMTDKYLDTRGKEYAML